MRTLIYITLILITNQTFSQITSTKIADAKPTEIKTVQYDSTRNFLGEDIFQIIGQTLYLPPKSENLQKYGYEGFVKDYTDTKTIGNSKNVYKCCDGYNSKYSELKDKYFEVLDVHYHPDRDRNKSLYGKKYFLKLRENKKGDIVYFLYDAKYERSFPFIIVGFFEKQKKESIGLQFISRGRNWRETVFNEDKPLNDITTGKEVILMPGSEWKVVDLTLEEKYFTLSYIIQNDNGSKLTLDIPSASRTRCVFRKKDVQDIIDNYPQLWKEIVIGKVVVGMTERMVKLSWGEPDKINRASYGDQWVYGDQYLYFDDGKLKSFN